MLVSESWKTLNRLYTSRNACIGIMKCFWMHWRKVNDTHVESNGGITMVAIPFRMPAWRPLRWEKVACTTLDSVSLPSLFVVFFMCVMAQGRALSHSECVFVDFSTWQVVRKSVTAVRLLLCPESFFVVIIICASHFMPFSFCLSLLRLLHRSATKSLPYKTPG